MALTDTIRAAVYARDRAICSFSGLSLWILDQGASPRAQNDWPDHKVPKSRGGSDQLRNLACASHFYNGKKSNNGSDAAYLFSEGYPTEQFYWTHGVLTEEQADIVRRHQTITKADWYFNRSLYSIITALDNKWSRYNAARSSQYWQSAAFKRLARWQMTSSTESADFVARGLVKYPNSPDVQLMLALRNARVEDIGGICRRLYVYYAANANALSAFTKATDDQARRKALDRAEHSGKVTEPMLHLLRVNERRLRSD